MPTLRSVKQLKPSDAEERPELSNIPEKMPAQAITAPLTQQAGSQADVQTPVSMRFDERMEEEGSQSEPSHTPAAEFERVATSGEGGKHGANGARSKSGDDVVEDDATSAVSWATMENTVAAESGAEGTSEDGKHDRPAACKGSQVERTPSLKGKPAARNSSAERGTWCDKKGNDRPHGFDVLQTAYDKYLSNSAMQEKHKAGVGRPQRSARKVRRDAAGRPRGRTSGSENEEAPSKHPGRKPVADDKGTDSNFF
ncbi:hypothetical protein MRX96_017418 [Rhipicephalus microplus]